MNHFYYKEGSLHVEGVSLDKVAEDVGTPFYCYSTATLTRHYTVFQDALAGLNAKICFALKANANLSVIRTLADLGAGADVVSGGELLRALAANIPPNKIVFSGIGKTRSELALAIDHEILQINVESWPELQEISRLAVEMGRNAKIALRINPDIDANTHAKITTGRLENKFGIEWVNALQIMNNARYLPGITLVGIAMHIGSQITSLQPFQDAFQRIRELVISLRDNGIAVTSIDLGGGLGIPYHDDQPLPPSPMDYAGIVRNILGDLGCLLIFEPGRLLVGNAGILVSRITYMKDGATRRFAICDAGMNDLVRPAMYEAWHEILSVKEADLGVKKIAIDVVGPICETSDTFGTQRFLPPLQAGDLLAFMTAGAYGSVMSSSYNLRLPVPEVLVKDDRYAIIRARPDYQQLFSLDRMPDWLV